MGDSGNDGALSAKSAEVSEAEASGQAESVALEESDGDGSEAVPSAANVPERLGTANEIVAYDADRDPDNCYKGLACVPDSGDTRWPRGLSHDQIDELERIPVRYTLIGYFLEDGNRVEKKLGSFDAKTSCEASGRCSFEELLKERENSEREARGACESVARQKDALHSRETGRCRFIGFREDPEWAQRWAEFDQSMADFRKRHGIGGNERRVPRRYESAGQVARGTLLAPQDDTSAGKEESP